MRCGYDSPSAFIAAFKRHFGMTPKQFANAR
jgi:AraC-like DNA-binding protein